MTEFDQDMIDAKLRAETIKRIEWSDENYPEAYEKTKRKMRKKMMNNYSYFKEKYQITYQKKIGENVEKFMNSRWVHNIKEQKIEILSFAGQDQTIVNAINTAMEYPNFIAMKKYFYHDLIALEKSKTSIKFSRVKERKKVALKNIKRKVNQVNWKDKYNKKQRNNMYAQIDEDKNNIKLNSENIIKPSAQLTKLVENCVNRIHVIKQIKKNKYKSENIYKLNLEFFQASNISSSICKQLYSLFAKKLFNKTVSQMLFNSYEQYRRHKHRKEQYFIGLHETS